MRRVTVMRNGDAYHCPETDESWVAEPMFVIVTPGEFEDWQYLEPPEYHDV